MTDLRIAADLTLPVDAVTQTFGILARKGAGKTYTALVMAEEMIKASLPVVILDPLGACWGLRVSADGTGPGLPVTILGGEHADIPLEPTAGKVVADIIVEHPGAFILDMSGFESNAAQDRFVTDFAERIYRAKATKREPLHLIIDEADSFAPQSPMPGQQRMLGAFEAIVRRGRIRGLGVTLVTQRPAVLNKNVLTQCECLITLQMTSPQDRKAIDEWVRGNGTKEERDELLGSLASLDRGDAWFWSPAWLRIFKRIHVRQRETWDSSKTPEPGDVMVEPTEMAAVDLAQLQQRMAATIERAKTDDPKELRARIKELERLQDQATTRLGDWIIAAELSGFDTPKGMRERIVELEQHTKAVEVPVLSDETIAELKGTVDSMCATAMRLLDLGGEIRSALVGVRQSADVIGAETKRDVQTSPKIVPSTFREPNPQPGQKSKLTQPRGAQASSVAADTKISGPQQRILDALAEMEAVGLSDLDRSNVAVYADASPRSSAFGNNLGALRSANLISYSSPGRVALTPEGREQANIPAAPRTLEQFHDAWRSHLSGPQGRILGELIALYPDAVERDRLAEIAGASPTSSAYGNNLGHMRGLGIIIYPARGLVAASELLFPAGLR